MPTLLKPWKRTAKQRDGHADVIREERTSPPGPLDFFVLTPTEGGLSFRLFACASEQEAGAYATRFVTPNTLSRRHIAFKALHTPDPPEDCAEAVEAVVLVRDIERPGIVNLYSFVDMGAANSYVRQEAALGLDMRNVLMYWAAPIDITSPGEMQTPVPANAAPPESAPTVQAKAAPPEPKAPVQAKAAPPEPKAPVQAKAAPVAPTRVSLPRRPTGPAPREVQRFASADAPAAQWTAPTDAVRMDTRKRVHVSPNGAVFDDIPEPVQVTEEPRPRGWASERLAQVQAWGGWDGLAPLMIRATFVNEDAYQEFEHDQYAGGRARLIVALGAIAAAIGATGSGLTSMIVHGPAFALGWAALAFTVYAIGTQAFPGRQGKDVQARLVRALGLAMSPALLVVLGIVPTFGPLFVLGAYIWVLLASTTAITATLELNRDSSLIAATVGCLVMFTVSQVVPLVLI